MDVAGFNEEARRLLEFYGIDRPVCLYEPEVGDNVYRPLCEVASSKLARKTLVDMLNKVQINYYAAGGYIERGQRPRLERRGIGCDLCLSSGLIKFTCWWPDFAGLVEKVGGLRLLLSA